MASARTGGGHAASTSDAASAAARTVGRRQITASVLLERCPRPWFDFRRKRGAPGRLESIPNAFDSRRRQPGPVLLSPADPTETGSPAPGSVRGDSADALFGTDYGRSSSNGRCVFGGADVPVLG